MLKDLLEQKKCFKLICGAGNGNMLEIERLVAVYAAAGCHFFDFSANTEVLLAAQKGLDFAIPKEKQKDYHFCISVGTKDDQHVQKAKIDREKCTQCGICVALCPQNAIDKNFQVIEEYCIGCFRCKSGCNYSAINGYSKNKPFNLSDFQTFNLSCIELHASEGSEKEIDDIWENLNKNFDGFLSLCVGRGKLSNEEVLNRIQKLIAERKPHTTIIQTDGSPMSGGKDDYQTTLQAVAMAEVVQNANLPVYIMPSGGTNSKTKELAKLCNVYISGVAAGSFARKIIKEYIEQDNFFENQKLFAQAVTTAKELVDACFN